MTSSRERYSINSRGTFGIGPCSFNGEIVLGTFTPHLLRYEHIELDFKLRCWRLLAAIVKISQSLFGQSILSSNKYQSNLNRSHSLFVVEILHLDRNRQLVQVAPLVQLAQMIDVNDFLTKFRRNERLEEHPHCFHPPGRMHHHQSFYVFLVLSIETRVNLFQVLQTWLVRLRVAVVKVNDRVVRRHVCVEFGLDKAKQLVMLIARVQWEATCGNDDHWQALLVNAANVDDASLLELGELITHFTSSIGKVRI